MYELNSCEKSYLRKIIINTRNTYFTKNKYILMEDNLDIDDENLLDFSDNVETNFENKIEKEISYLNIQDVFSEEKIIKSVKSLTSREKLVIFLYYFEDKTDEKVGNILNIKGDTVRKIRTRALGKIKKEYERRK